MITFNSYQESTRETAVYPGAGTGGIEALAYVGLGLGETGEVQGKIKKVIRDDYGVLSQEKALQILHELGDVLWYVARTADEIGFSLEEVARRNVEKLNSRKERGVLQGSGDNR